MKLMSVQVLGAMWYLLSVERQYSCWKQECKKEYNGTHSPSCELSFLDCSTAGGPARDAWLQTTKLLTTCNPRANSIDFQFGMFAEAFVEEVSSENFIPRLFYCLWWGLKNLRYMFNFLFFDDFLICFSIPFTLICPLLIVHCDNHLN